MSNTAQHASQSFFSRIADPAEDPVMVSAMLRIAEGLPELRGETRIWQAIQALQSGRPWEAWAYLISKEIAPALQGGTMAELPQLLASAARAQDAEALAVHLLQLYPDTTAQHASAPPTKSAESVLQTTTFKNSNSRAARPRDTTVDIIIPVYRGRTETMACLNSVLASQALLRCNTEIVVINDASPQDDLVADLQELASAQQITLVEQPENLGFIRTMNRAMALHPQRDVVWLNADTRVTGNWLDRLRGIANKDPDIAAVSPLSNHGELMSFPHQNRQGFMPDAATQKQLDTLAKKAWNGEIADLEAVCGFCLYMRRCALDEVGFLDEKNLVAGYGEDTDWSQRALALGWRLTAAPNVFVAHHGSVSFGSQKKQLVARNNAVLTKRYPRMEQEYDSYLQRDPLADHRHRLQRQRLIAITSKTKAANKNKKGALVTGELLILGPASWNHPALAHSRLDPYGADGSLTEPLPIDQHPWLRWRPVADSREPDACKVSLSLPLADQSLPICLEYRLPQDLTILEDDLAGLPDMVWAFYELECCPTALLRMCQRLKCKLRLYPLDDALLSAAAQAGTAPESAPESASQTTRAQLLLDLAQTADAVVLPYSSLLYRYLRALPYASIEIKPWTGRSALEAEESETQEPEATDAQAKDSAEPTTPRSLLIADDLERPALIHKWLELARTLSEAQSQTGEYPLKLLILNQYPCSRELRSLGNLIEIAPIAGVSLPESLELCHCTAALSLDSDPGAGWRAPGLAAHLGLPLLAPATALAVEAEANTFTSVTDLTCKILNINLSTKAVTMTIKRAKAKSPFETMPKKRAKAKSLSEPWQVAANRKVFLNLGSGNGDPSGLPGMFQGGKWQQIRIDIDPDMSPDIVTSNTDLSMIPDGQIDAIWSSHSLEHLEFHDVPSALKEMQRVLKADGFALITLPDLAAVAELVVAGRLTDIIYQSPVGPIRAIDMMFGHGDSLADGKGYMAHRCGFDAQLLGESLLDAGFHEVRVRKGRSWDLWAFALNSETPQSVFELEV
jgi:GT2 family glycosyltransferase/SAM-dependent methyltransferase